MKTTDYPRIGPDEVITEVRRIKTALAAKHNFDVMAMIRSLQERERKEKCEQGGAPNAHPRHASC